MGNKVYGGYDYTSNVDTDAAVDMLITCRGQFVFAWAEADEVIHVWDCSTREQRPRLMDVEEPWNVETLETIADAYLRETRLTPLQVTFSNSQI